MTLSVRALTAVAAVLAVLSLGLPWDTVPGAAHPARVAVVGVLVLLVVAHRTGRPRLLTVAAVVGAVGVLLGGLDPTPGRLALAAAAACVALAARATPAPGR